MTVTQRVADSSRTSAPPPGRWTHIQRTDTNLRGCSLLSPPSNISLPLSYPASGQLFRKHGSMQQKARYNTSFYRKPSGHPQQVKIGNETRREKTERKNSMLPQSKLFLLFAITFKDKYNCKIVPLKNVDFFFFCKELGPRNKEDVRPGGFYFSSMKCWSSPTPRFSK